MPDDTTNTPSPADYATVATGEGWPESYQRPRGIFTDVDRQFLWGVKEYDSRVTTSERRGGIRDRAVEGLRDLNYLTFLDDGQREDVFEKLEAETPEGQLRVGVSALIEFLYRGLDADVEWMEETIAHGIQRAEAERDEADRYGSRTVDVDIEVSHGYDLDRLERIVEKGRAPTLTEAEIGALVRGNRVDADNLSELQRHDRSDNPVMGDADPTLEVDGEGDPSDSPFADDE
jgi:hypothetical protein